MKKLLCLSTALLGGLVLSGCSSSSEKLYILNWQEYISEDLVEEFENEFDVEVISKELVSNELMYSELQRGISYDVVFPSDYMIEKLKNENLLLQLDKELLPAYTSNEMYSDGLKTLIDASGYDDYFVPYFWGSLGIMYNTRDPKHKEVVEEYGWEVFFNNTILDTYQVAMYDSSRDSFAAAAMYMQTVRDDSIRDESFSINSYSQSQLDKCAALLKGSKYSLWGTDNIKTRIASGNVDIGLVYSGDFFDQLYIDDYENVKYDIFVPETNNVFYDGMCIPKNADNPELAHKFINFMMTHENAVANAFEVGYCPTIEDVYKEVIADEEMADIISYGAWHPNRVTNGTVYKDLKETYIKMEDAFGTVKQ